MKGGEGKLGMWVCVDRPLEDRHLWTAVVAAARWSAGGVLVAPKLPQPREDAQFRL